MSKNPNKLPFAQKHPRINLIFGLLLCAGLGFGCFKLIEYSVSLLSQGILFLIETVSKLDAVLIVTLITGAVSLVGVIISSVIGKVVEYKKSRNEYLYQKREDPYSDFMEIFNKILTKGKLGEKYDSVEMEKDFASLNGKLILWGSNKVIKKWLEVRKLQINESGSETKILFLLEEMLYAIRKDLGHKRMQKGNILGMFITDIKNYLPKRK